MSGFVRVRVKASTNQPARRRGGKTIPGRTGSSAARAHDGETARVQATPQELFALATQEPASPLPHREALEDRVGHSLSDVRVYSGPAAQSALEALGARAAARGRELLLSEPDPGLEVLLHEVVHVLQSEQPEVAPRQEVAPEGSAPEQEAQDLSGQAALSPPEDAAHLQPAPVQAGLHPETIALQRTSVADPYPALRQEWVVVPEQAFSVAVAESPAPPTVPAEEERAREEAAAAARAGAGAPSATPAATRPPSDLAAAGEAAAAEAAPTEAVETPELGEAQAPEVAPTAAAQPSEGEAAAAAEAAAQATAALEGAQDVDELVEKFAAAPPTVKAQHAAQVGERAGEFTRQDAAQIQAETPEFHAELNSPVQDAPPLRVEAPEARPVTLEATTPPPAPEPDIPPTPEPGRFTANEGVPTQLERRLSAVSEGESTARAAQVGESLQDVQTSDPSVETTPGPPPAVPLEGDTDPARVQNQAQAGAEQATQARLEAQQAVAQGPGPEQVQPLQMDETYAVQDLTQPEVIAPTTPEGPEQYLAMNLPPEVQASFDQTQGPAMQTSLEGAQSQISQASEQRDQDRESRVLEAQGEADRLSQDANQQQSDQVLEARQQIQTERQNTLDQQNQEVARVEGDIETRRGEDSQAIDTRVQSDQRQIQDRYAQTEREAQSEVSHGEQQAVEERERAEREAEDQSWWDRAVNFIKDAFNALTRVIGAIFDAVRAAVNRLLDAVKAFAQALIDAAANFIKNAIAAFGEFLKGLVNALLADIFPELAAALNRAIDAAVQLAQQAVDRVANALKEGINALVEGLRAGLNAVINTFQAAVNTALALVEAAITGDWSGLLKKVLEAVLQLIGVNPEEFYAFIGRAEETFQIIVNDPGGFLGHVLDAVVGGIQKFADNFLTHLQAGIIGWLTGALGGAGITLPEHFDLMGVLSLVQQILGLTWDRLREKAVRLIGEQAVAILEFVVSYLQTLIEGGWQALFERIQQDLSNLVDMVLDGIKSFLLERIVIAAITRLATLFNPVGAIVQLVMAAWNLYTFLRDRLSRIIQVVQTVVDAIGNIARGVIEPAALKVEEVLAGLLPLVIDLLARFLGLGGIAEKVREIIEQVRAAVDRAIDSLIERVKALFRGGGAQAGEGAAGVGTAGGLPQAHFTAGREEHTVRVVLEGRRANILLASNEQDIDRFIANLTQRVNALPAGADKERLSGQIEQVRTLSGGVEESQSRAAVRAASAPGVSSAQASETENIQAQVDHLAQALTGLLVWASSVPADFTPGAIQYNPQGNRAARAQGWLARNAAPRSGEEQSAVSGPVNTWINHLRVQGVNIQANFDAGHLIGSRYGGEGTRRNLVPMESRMNRSWFNSFEARVDTYVEQGQAIYADVQASYGGDPFVRLVDPEDLSPEQTLESIPILEGIPQAIVARVGRRTAEGQDQPLFQVSFDPREHLALTLSQSRRGLVGVPTLPRSREVFQEETPQE